MYARAAVATTILASDFSRILLCINFVVIISFSFDSCSSYLRDNDSGASAPCTKHTSRCGLGWPSRVFSQLMQCGENRSEGVEYFTEFWSEQKLSFSFIYAQQHYNDKFPKSAPCHNLRRDLCMYIERRLSNDFSMSQ